MKSQTKTEMSVAQTDPGPGSNSAACTPMTRRSYLVLSMGFWPKLPDIRFIQRIASTIPATDLVAVVHPESVLPHARRYASQCDTIVNLDCHAGIGGGEELVFDDGQEDFRRFELSDRTWGDYINFDHKAGFIWGHPLKECAHMAECRADVFNDPDDVPFERITQKFDGAWEALRHYIAKPPDYGVDLTTTRAVAFVVAPGRCSLSALRILLSVLNEYKIKMLDWRREAFGDRWLFNEIERGGSVL